MVNCLALSVPTAECALIIVEVMNRQMVIAELFAAYLIFNIIIYIIAWSIIEKGRIGKKLKGLFKNVDLERFYFKKEY